MAHGLARDLHSRYPEEAPQTKSEGGILMNLVNYAVTSPVTVTPQASVDRAIHLMEENAIAHLVVVHHGRVVGMLSDRDILISTGWMLAAERQATRDLHERPVVVGPTRVEQIMSRPALVVQAGESPRRAALLMLERKVGALPVFHDGKLAGLLCESDLLDWLDRLAHCGNAADQLLGQPVGNLMHRAVQCVCPDDSIEDIIGIFRNRRVRHVPVLSNDSLVGIVSDRDVRRAVGWSMVRDLQADEERRIAAETAPSLARHIMQRNVLVIGASTPVRDALRLMLAQGVHSLPVVERGRLVGIVTRTDLVRLIAQADLM